MLVRQKGIGYVILGSIDELIKAREPKIRSASDLLKIKGWDRRLLRLRLQFRSARG
jgi:hypothetical protein